MATFDVSKESWIPVINGGGAAEEISLRDVLYRAHKLIAVRDPLPTVEFGIYRLLTAFVLDIFEPRTPSGLQTLLKTGHFDRGCIDEYFEKYADRFDLFDGKHPFLQSSGMETDESKPLAGLIPPIPSGSNNLHFHHVPEEQFAVSAGAAARLLTTIAPFMDEGGRGLPPSVNGKPPWYAWLNKPGGTLFDSICLNCCVVPLPQASGIEGPSWRSARKVASEPRAEASSLEALTWRPRRIQLEAGGPGACSLTGESAHITVKSMKFAPGFASRFSPAWTDPAVPYFNSDNGPQPLRPREGREIWRDTGAIALLRHDNFHYSRPRLVDQFADLARSRTFGETVALNVTLYGLRTRVQTKMKVYEWHREILSLPAELLWQRSAYQQAQLAMERAEKTSHWLKQAIKRVYPREGKGNSGAFDTIIGCAEQQFWSRLRRQYELLLIGIAPLSPEDDSGKIRVYLEDWEKKVKTAGWEALGVAIDDLDSDSEALKRQVEARKFFGGAVNRAFDESDPSTRKPKQTQNKSTEATLKGE